MVEANVDDYFHRLGNRPSRRPWNRRCTKLFQAAQIGGYGVGEPRWSVTAIQAPEFSLARAGSELEVYLVELEETTKQVSEAKELLKESVNEMSALSNALFPLMKSQIESIRSARMAIQAESRDTVRALEDVRKFFLDSDYETEMARLERFVRLCREFQQLKSDGVIDDVADISIRMALREVRSDA